MRCGPTARGGCAAFAVGGIPDWLHEGENGALAPGDPPTSAGLADAVARCLDPAMYPSLRRGAYAAAQRHSLDAHLDRLEEVFRGVLDHPAATRAAASGAG